MASSSRLKPSEKGNIKATLHTGGIRGPLVKTVVVISNDPKMPRTILTLRASLKAITLPTPSINSPAP